MPSARRTLHYRCVNFLPQGGHNLEQLLRAALDKAPGAESRERNLGDNIFQVLNTTATVRNTLCGSFHRWVHGQNQLVVDRVKGAKIWNISEVSPPPTPQGGANQRDFLSHTLYFGIRGNHAVILQGQGMQVTEFSQYLTWLLCTHVAEVVPADLFISLDPATAKSLRAKGVDRAKAVMISRPLSDLREREPAGRRKKKWYEKIVPRERADAFTKTLQALGIQAPDNLLQQIEAKDIEIVLEIRRPRGRDPLGNSVMNQIGKLVSLQESDDYAVELLDGSILRGSELKLSDMIEVTIPDGLTHPSEGSVFIKVDEYLHGLIARGIV